MNKIEILAPCGGMDSVYSAVRSGADAVYIGTKNFSARANAENFTFEQLREVVDYCHINRVKVYVTLNTVVFDDELEKVKETIIDCSKAKVDALILQDIGVAQLAKKIVPQMPLHGSTQMSVHSLSGAKILQEMGFSRVVLSREMTREEIKEIADNCSIELEVFVHGALCMSVSGQCYFSAMLGSRSGNRGRCAQPCRLPFSVNNKKGYGLSLKDNSIISYIKDLEKIGVTSAKIEGRMKRPEYVSTAVKACFEARNNGFVSKETEENLKKIFSRTGFTDGYYKNQRGYEMFGYRQKEDVVSADTKLFSQIHSQYKNELQRVKLKGSFECEIGKKPILTLTDGNFTVTAEGNDVCETAVNKPLDKERCEKQLRKTGGTPYIIEKIDIKLQEELAVSMASINDLRRKAIEKLNCEVVNSVNYYINDIDLPKINPHINTEEKKRYVRVIDTELGQGFKEADLCFVPIFSKSEEIQRLVAEGYKIGVEIPRGLFGREKQIEEKLDKIMQIGITDVLCNNLGAVYIAKNKGAKIHGGFGLNFTNTLDLLWAEEYGFEDIELSFELTEKQINQLGGNLKRGIISYGYLPLMITRNCPNKSINMSCSKCKKQGKMQDRIGKSFIFYCDGCLTEVLNSACLDALEIVENSTNIDFEVFRITVENSVENVENILDFLRYNLKSGSKTHGLYKRGVL